MWLKRSNHLKNTFKYKIFSILVSAIFFLLPQQVQAAGGYLSFPKPANAPRALDLLDFTFQMVSNPGPGGGTFYAHSFNFLSSDYGSAFGGYIGLQSTGIIGKESYALVTIWPPKGRVLSFKNGPNAKCNAALGTAEGDVASCVITSDHPLANAMQNGDYYRIYIFQVGGTVTPIQSITYQFGIYNYRTNENHVLGEMQLANVAGINSSGVSHFLEYFDGGNAGDCTKIPYTSYVEHSPNGWYGGSRYVYTVEPHSEPFGPCPVRLTQAANASSVKVEFSTQKLLGDIALIRQDELNKLDSSGSHIKSLFEKHSNVKIVTSNGNWVPKITLPADVKDGYMVSLQVDSTYSLTAQYGSNTVSLPRGSKVLFVRRGGVWNYDGEFKIGWQKELSNLDSSGDYLKSILNERSPVRIRTSDGAWISNITLPANSVEGRSVFFQIDSGYGVTVNYGRESAWLPNQARRQFVYRNGAWSPITYEVPDLSKMDSSGAYLKDLFLSFNSNVQVNTWNGFWTQKIVLPSDPINGSRVIFNIKSTFPVEISYNGRSVTLGTGSLRTFVFESGAWVLN